MAGGIIPAVTLQIAQNLAGCGRHATYRKWYICDRFQQELAAVSMDWREFKLPPSADIPAQCNRRLNYRRRSLASGQAAEPAAA
jgi:hypothetical protein